MYRTVVARSNNEKLTSKVQYKALISYQRPLGGGADQNRAVTDVGFTVNGQKVFSIYTEKMFNEGELIDPRKEAVLNPAKVQWCHYLNG